MAQQVSLYRRFVRKTWRQPRFRALLQDNPVKGLFLAYLWTGPDSHTPGIYYITPGTIAEDLGVGLETVTEWLGELSADGWFEYDFEARVIFLPKWFEYDAPSNGNVVKGWAKYAVNLPNTPLILKYLNSLQPFAEKYDIPLANDLETVRKRFGNDSETPEPEPQPDTDPDPKKDSKSHSRRENVDNSTLGAGEEADSKPKYTPEDEVRRENLRSILKKVGTWRCMERQKNPYAIAQKILDLFGGDYEFCLLFLERKKDVLKITNDGGHLLGALTRMKWQDSEWRDIESESHRERDRVERSC